MFITYLIIQMPSIYVRKPVHHMPALGTGATTERRRNVGFLPEFGRNSDPADSIIVPSKWNL